SLGNFPIYKVSDYANKVPSEWKKEAHFIPIWPQEAMWIGFNYPAKPLAISVGAGMVNAVTGDKLSEGLSQNPQNYIVIPPQPWLDGFKSSVGGKVYQFVGTELGKGETAEEQIFGSAEFGGIQFGLHTSKIPLVSSMRPHEHVLSAGFSYKGVVRTRGAIRTMGLGAGGSIRQKIYPDPYVTEKSVNEIWSDEPVTKVWVYLVHANDFRAITGMEPPQSPVTYAHYQALGYPWFGLHDGSWGDTSGSEKIDNLKPVSGNPDQLFDEPKKDPSTDDLW
ncbi:MAG: hypothetical protein HYZ69_02955, partial [Candidatus Colwellbacteria bacterium]|nr:hypothetical protein [Candidatus Colwellbacteria bacterium]